MNINELTNINDVRESATIFPRPCKLTFGRPFDLESGVRVTRDVGYLFANFGLPIGLSVLELFPMYATDRRQTDVRQKHRLMPHLEVGHNKLNRSLKSTFSLLLRLV